MSACSMFAEGLLTANTLINQKARINVKWIKFINGIFLIKYLIFLYTFFFRNYNDNEN